MRNPQLRWFSPLVCLFAIGCGTEDEPVESDSCIAEHGRLGIEGETTLASDVEERCVEDGGRGCEVSALITREAAVCIAEREGLADGVRGWMTTLRYIVRDDTDDRADRGRPSWSVQNTEYAEPDGSQGGQVYVIDANTGELLLQLGWGAAP